MAEFSLSKVGLLRLPGGPRRKAARKKATHQAIAKTDTDAATLAVAKIIDPDAWSDQPQPTVAQLQQQIVGLTEDIEWLLAALPAGSRQREQALRFAGQVRPDEVTTNQRRNMALERARRALDAFDQFSQPNQRVLLRIIRPGRKPLWRNAKKSMR